jgi:PEP-CTERM/exosortase A-associated glycosyltransferase
MKIAHILDHSLPLHSGYAFRTVAILREQRSLGWDTVHLTTPKQGESVAGEEVADGWRFYRTAPPRSGLSRLPGVSLIAQIRATARRLGEVVRREKPDVLHAHSPVLNALPALWVGRQYGIPVVYELRALWEDAAVDHGTMVEDGVRYRLSRALETFALRRVDQIVTICEGLREDVVARGIAADKVTVVPNAVDTEAFRFGGIADPELKRTLGLNGNSVIGFAGSFYKYEGLDLLIDAVDILRRSHPDVRLLLVGGGAQESNLKARVERLGLQAHAVFTGRVAQAQVQRYYDLIDVLAYPRYRMRLTDLVTPLKPLEAMAQGRVLVASDVGGHKELIRDGQTGYLFPAGNAQALAARLAHVLANREGWDRVRNVGRRFVESERTWTSSVARYEAVYRRLVDEPRLALEV